jgi:predicted kinase
MMANTPEEFYRVRDLGVSNLLALRGISGSGKSTYARELKAQGWVVVSRDDIRETMFRDYQSVDEDVVTVVQDAAIRAALKAGRRVVVDDTNIRVKYLKRFVKIAQDAGALFEVKQFDCDANEAIKRVEKRFMDGGRNVPEMVIRKQAQGLKSSKLDWNELYDQGPTFEPYERPAGKPWAILVDVDGTLAHNDGHRGWYDYEKVYGDIVKEDIAEIVRTYAEGGYHKVIIMSGRDDVCQDETARWLTDNGIPFDEIHMRKTGDQRKDSIVKMELFDEFVRDNYRVEFVLDDRNQVVEAWRGIGLTCLQVAPGDF